jgi:hypothetical protein
MTHKVSPLHWPWETKPDNKIKPTKKNKRDRTSFTVSIWCCNLECFRLSLVPRKVSRSGYIVIVVPLFWPLIACLMLLLHSLPSSVAWPPHFLPSSTSSLPNLKFSYPQSWDWAGNRGQSRPNIVPAFLPHSRNVTVGNRDYVINRAE